MTALLDMKGNLAHSLPILCDLLDVKGKLLPLTEDNVHLIGITKEREKIVGEAEITESKRKIKDLKYNKKVTVAPRVHEEIKKADLIIFSFGSLLTSVMPHIIVSEIKEAIKKSKAKTMYICNMLTQPGETDDFKVSNHIKVIEKYLGKKSINVVIANNSTIPNNMALLAKSEGKDPVEIDKDKLEKMGVHIIAEKLFKVEEGYVRHNPLKTAYLIFSYLMEGE